MFKNLPSLKVYFLPLVVYLILSYTAFPPAHAEDVEDTLITKTVKGVHFLVEPDRKIQTDPVTGILIPEPIDQYMSRKFRAFKEEKDEEIRNLESKIEELAARLDTFERGQMSEPQPQQIKNPDEFIQ